jgi:hypothetical protein
MGGLAGRFRGGLTGRLQEGRRRGGLLPGDKVIAGFDEGE